MHDRIDINNILIAVIFSAFAVILPLIFHLIGLGAIFMPMYLPLAIGAFMMNRSNAFIAGAVTPLVSSIMTGMPPLYPPIAVIVSFQLSIFCLDAGWITGC
jgi:hypothetical protein